MYIHEAIKASDREFPCITREAWTRIQDGERRLNVIRSKLIPQFMRLWEAGSLRESVAYTLEVPSSFYVKTPWYKPYATTLSLGAAGSDSSKRYDYTYDDDLMYGVDSSGSLAGELRGGGHIPGSLELIYYGAITNPKIRIVGNLSGKTFGICSVTAVLIASDRLEYSSRREQSYVRKVSADGTVTDLLDSLDLSTTPFPHIPVDEPVTISIEADAAFTGSADLTLFYYYRSV